MFRAIATITASFTLFQVVNDLKFALLGILIGVIYIVKFRSAHIEEESQAPVTPVRTFGRTYLANYFASIYCPPVPSERVLGGFFFGKTLITTAIAFYYVDSLTLVLILAFSATFDSLTGIYQHTLMNYFHLSMFKNKILRFVQNIVKRFALDIVRAEIIMLILMGSEVVASSTQFHIFRNRAVSASYYLNAVIVDKLVEMGVISRNFRSHFVIVVSTIGGMLCLLDFAKTSFPYWVPQEVVASIPAAVPGPLQLLMYFNISIFIVMGSVFLVAKYQEQKNWVPKNLLLRSITRVISSILLS